MADIPRRTVLLVEDEPGIADAAAYALEREGFEIARAATLGEARRRLGGAPVSFIVLDVGLPDGSGFDFCREVRARSDVPILFLTARSEEVDRVVGLELGADDYLAKPFSPRELAARVKAVLRRVRPAARGDDSDAHADARRGEPPPPVEAPANPEGVDPGPRTTATSARAQDASPFSIDEERCRITYFGTPLELSRLEYRLLLVFLRRPGRVYSRSQLLDLAWDEPDASLERTVDSHVKMLRAKLRRARSDLDPIQTHRGLGYSMRETW